MSFPLENSLTRRGGQTKVNKLEVANAEFTNMAERIFTPKSTDKNAIAAAPLKSE